MLTYRCWHYLCKETVRLIRAGSSHAARREFARMLGVDTVDVIAQRVEP